MVAIHQILPVFLARDAIGNHTVAMQQAFRDWGVTSEIFAGDVIAGAGHGARPLADLDRRRGRKSSDSPDQTWLLYHAATGSSVADWFASRPERKLLNYHNITPAELLSPWEPHIGVEVAHGRRQLADLAPLVDWAFADSSYNAGELQALGYRRTSVVPILLDTRSFLGNVDNQALGQLRQQKAAQGGPDWLFVSRLMPHKAHHDVIKAFAAYRRLYDPAARLHLVGGVGSRPYAEALVDFVDDLDLGEAVHFTGSVTSGMLEALYTVADVYVALSDHEGFGVPLLEAMAHGVPVVAYACTAVPETVGGGGVLLDEKRPTKVAAAVHCLLTDGALRDRLVHQGHRRVGDFQLSRSTRTLHDALRALLADAGVAA